MCWAGLALACIVCIVGLLGILTSWALTWPCLSSGAVATRDVDPCYRLRAFCAVPSREHSSAACTGSMNLF